MFVRLSGLPTSIEVSNARLELDKYPSGSPASGSGSIRKLSRYTDKYKATWNYEDKDKQKPWITGGPFSISADQGTVFWSGNFTDDDPQVCNGGSALADFIKDQWENHSGYIAFTVFTGESGAVKVFDGARLKFDYTESGTPAITGFSPESMNFGDTPTLNVFGSNLDAGTLDAIQLVGGSTYSLTGIVRDSATQVHGTIPSGVAVGSYTVRVRIGGVNYDSSGSFSVNSVTPTITKVYGNDGGDGFVKHYRRTVTIEGASLGGAASIDLLAQEGQGDVSLTGVTVVSPVGSPARYRRAATRSRSSAPPARSTAAPSTSRSVRPGGDLNRRHRCPTT